MNEKDIQKLRDDINRLNGEIIRLLAERVNIAKQIGEVKKKLGKPVIDTSREAVVYEQVKQHANDMNLDQEGVEKVFEYDLSTTEKTALSKSAKNIEENINKLKL